MGYDEQNEVLFFLFFMFCCVFSRSRLFCFAIAYSNATVVDVVASVDLFCSRNTRLILFPS